MPRGSKEAYTEKQKRKAEHIEESYEGRGVSKDEAEKRAWATVNKESGGGNKSGSGRGKKESHESSRKGGITGGKATAKKAAAKKKPVEKKAATKKRVKKTATKKKAVTKKKPAAKKKAVTKKKPKR